MGDSGWAPELPAWVASRIWGGGKQNKFFICPELAG